MLSIIIPTYKEKYLQKTVEDLLQNARGEIEIIIILDGYWPDALIDDDRIKFIHYTDRRGLRNAVNNGIKISHGEYVMKIDAHCSFDKDFDLKLLKDIEDDQIVVPRRYKLNTEKWTLCDDEPIDYERIIVEENSIYGQPWPRRTRERKDILVDENITFQGSCWTMSRKLWDKIGGLEEDGYGTFVGEPMELTMKTWLSGGKIMLNKKTWYAHQHRDFGRTHHVHEKEYESGRAYAKKFFDDNNLQKVLNERFNYSVYNG